LFHPGREGDSLLDGNSIGQDLGLLVTPECLINQNQKWFILEFDELIHHQAEKLFFKLKSYFLSPLD
jgi:hypothetical protein